MLFMSSIEKVALIGSAAIGTEKAVADLREAGFEITEVQDGRASPRVLDLLAPDLVLVDLRVSACSGLDICRAAKALADAPVVIVLASSAGENERIAAYEAGADDFIMVPANARELLLRVRAVLRRRSARKPPRKAGLLRAGVLALDADAGRAEVGGATIELTLLEFRLLWTLASRAGGVQHREALLREVWGPAVNVEARTVDQHVKRLRKKLGVARSLLRTVRGVGYRFESTGASELDSRPASHGREPAVPDLAEAHRTL